MKEVLFRARIVDTGKWIKGNLFKSEFQGEICFAIQDTVNGSWVDYVVDPQTIGQYTGKNDIEGTKIFEGDMLSDKFGFMYEVYFDEDEAAFMLRDLAKNPKSHRFSEIEFEFIIGDMYGKVDYKSKATQKETGLSAEGLMSKIKEYGDLCTQIANSENTLYKMLELIDVEDEDCDCCFLDYRELISKLKSEKDNLLNEIQSDIKKWQATKEKV